MNYKIVALTLLFCLTVFITPVKAEDLRILDAQQVYQMINSSDVVLIDNRAFALYERGHIPHALHMEYFKPQSEQNKMTAEMLKPFQGKTLIFYCSGRVRAYHAATQAMEWEISPDIFWFKGGWQEWTNYTNSMPIDKKE